MKSVATILAISAVLAVVSASGYGGGSSGGYGGAASIPAPPCPKNYLFSCQPNLAPAPCAPAPASYGSSGAYSENVPTIVNSPYGYQGLPLNLQQQFPQLYGQNFATY